jgi:hypothetical protein
MEAIFSSETSVETQRTVRGYIPEDATIQNCRCENLKLYIPHVYLFYFWVGYLMTLSALNLYGDGW